MSEIIKYIKYDFEIQIKKLISSPKEWLVYNFINVCNTQDVDAIDNFLLKYDIAIDIANFVFGKMCIDNKPISARHLKIWFPDIDHLNEPSIIPDTSYVYVKVYHYKISYIMLYMSGMYNGYDDGQKNANKFHERVRKINPELAKWLHNGCPEEIITRKNIKSAHTYI